MYMQPFENYTLLNETGCFLQNIWSTTKNVNKFINILHFLYEEFNVMFET